MNSIVILMIGLMSMLLLPDYVADFLGRLFMFSIVITILDKFFEEREVNNDDE